MEETEGQVETRSRMAKACDTVENGRGWVAIARQGGSSVFEFVEGAISPTRLGFGRL